MTSLKEVLDREKSYRAAAAALEMSKKKAEAVFERARKDYNQFIEKTKDQIRKGENTGDAFLDFLIDNNVSDIKKEHKRLTTINKTIKGYAGLVLIINEGETEDLIDSGGFSDLPKYSSRRYQEAYIGKHDGSGLFIGPYSTNMHKVEDFEKGMQTLYAGIRLEQKAYFYSNCDLFEDKNETLDEPVYARLFAHKKYTIFTDEKSILKAAKSKLSLNEEYESASQLLESLIKKQVKK